MQWKNLKIPTELRPDWLGDREICIPIEELTDPQIETINEKPVFNFDIESAISNLKEEKFAPDMASPSLKIPFPYIALPSFFRLAAAKLFYLPKRFFRKNKNPSWPVAPGTDILEFLTGKKVESKWNNNKWCVTITHDVDTVKGLRCCLKFADAVEKVGFHSCFYIVGSIIEKEPEIVKELHERGHEIGSHDLYHDNRLCFLPKIEMEERIKQARSLIESYGGVGFRSPSLLRSKEMITLVGKYFEYDSSICDTDLEYYRGCTTVFPYSLYGCAELPITLPMDSSLKYTGFSPSKMLNVWTSKCKYIRSIGGVGTLVNHAEPHLSGGGPLFNTFIEFLEWLKEQSDTAVLLPKEVVALNFSKENKSPRNS